MMMIVLFCSFVFFCVVVRGDVRGSFLVVVYVVACVVAGSSEGEVRERERERMENARLFFSHDDFTDV